ncbi:MAG: contractile injection system tape measure protein, partial [Flavisolibacter sp.]
QALNLRHNFAATIQSDIIEVVDEVCSRYISSDENIRIERIEIDLGNMSSNTLSNSFKEIFRYRFEKELKDRLSFVAAQQRNFSRQVSETEALQWYLLHGSLPWWAVASETDLDQAIEQVLRLEKHQLLNFLVRYRYHNALWKRLAWQFVPKIQKQVVGLLEELRTAEKILSEVVTRIIDPTFIQLIPHESSEKLEAYILSFVLTNAPALWSADEASISRFLKKFLREYFTDRKLTESGFSNPEPSTIVSKMEDRVFDQLKLFSVPEETSKILVNKKLTERADPSLKLSAASGGKEESLQIEEQEKFLASHSGIILLAPFFKPFFTELGLLNDNSWRREDSRYRAVHLLQFLCTGEEQLPEYRLILEKIICGLSPHHPLPRDIDLSEKERSESELLLTSVIGHWKILKNTSIQGFRENFLKREGLISRTEDGWLLQIERKTLDILLDSLPWGFSTVKLSWNDFILSVEW